jgi:hypothetical protein
MKGLIFSFFTVILVVSLFSEKEDSQTIVPKENEVLYHPKTSIIDWDVPVDIQYSDTIHLYTNKYLQVNNV